MIAIMIAIEIFIISILLGVIIWFLWRFQYNLANSFQIIHNAGIDIQKEIFDLKEELAKVWVISANITNGIDQMTKSIDQYRVDFKLTFDDKFAKRVEEIIGLGIQPQDTMQIIGMDGKPYIVPIDKGY